MMINMRTAVYTFVVVMLLVMSFLAGKEYNTYNYQKLYEANKYKDECLEKSDKCMAILNELIDRHMDTGIFDSLEDSLISNGYYRYEAELDSLYELQTK